MNTNRKYIALGLMSGTSADGVDASIIETDGHTITKHFGGAFTPYTPQQMVCIKNAYGKDADTSHASHIVTDVHIDAIEHCLRTLDMNIADVDVIGFHGQTTYHAPQDGITIQIGNPQKIATAFNTNVVADFRTNDVRNGGEGAPLAPIYHNAVCKEFGTVFLNLGGVANITVCLPDSITAFDTGPANALMDDYMQTFTDQQYDKNGDIAKSGKANTTLVDAFKTHPYFAKAFPKSLDRDTFKINFTDTTWSALSVSDAMATLAEMTIASVKIALDNFTDLHTLVVCGGGANNAYIIQRLKSVLDLKIITANDYGLDNDMLEANAFGYLAVRHMEKLPLSYPSTTNVKSPCLGGVLFTPNR